MRIRCGSCHEVLKDTDFVVMDILNGLSHYTCLFVLADSTKDVDTYGNIKEKYGFFHEKSIH